MEVILPDGARGGVNWLRRSEESEGNLCTEQKRKFTCNSISRQEPEARGKCSLSMPQSANSF